MSRLFAVAGALVERIKINAISREMRGGRAVWIKKRRKIAAPLMPCANRFFSLAGSPVRAIADLGFWQRWEVDCFHRLHGAEGFQAFCEGRSAVGADEMPGINLTRHLDGGTLTPPMAAAAARELRRAHATGCAFFGSEWSHGDPHLGNFMYDEATDRARLIDFEVVHERGLPAEERHADDLLVFLQDMMGRICPERWPPCAQAFLEAYDRPEIAALLVPKLTPPRHFLPRLWWLVRTTFLPVDQVRRRLAVLRKILEEIANSTPAPLGETEVGSAP